MQELGLSEIEKLWKHLNCREGLLIDFDYGAALTKTALKETSSGEKQGEGEQGEGEQGEGEQGEGEQGEGEQKEGKQKKGKQKEGATDNLKPSSGTRTVSKF